MKISGSATVAAPPGQVWAALNDPAVLARTIPGCERLEVTAPGACRLTATAAAASTQGTYTGDITVSERHEPASFRLAVNAAGEPGHLSASVLVQLTAGGDGGTEVSYDADAEVGGIIAGVGQLLLASTVSRQADQFFTALNDLLASPAVPTPSAVPTAPSAAPPPGVRAGGAAGVSSPADAATEGASGMTTEPPPADRQPAGRLYARPPTESFVTGVLVGAAIAVAGIGVARLLGRRAR